ncbi:MAG: hypothetical protein MJ133_11630, partial [Lachnospiraceae bacterium]|nr:hypothetical protein [Lachnospiraceae bacterium]
MNLSLKSSWICFQKRMYSGDIHPVHSTHVETVVLLSREKSRLAKDYVKVGIDAEEYYRIK